VNNQNEQATPVDSGQRPVDSLNPISLETELSTGSNVDAHVAANNYYQTHQQQHKRWPIIVLAAAVVLLLGGALALRVSRGGDQGSLANQNNAGAGFNTVSIPLDAFNTKGLESFETARIINVNGQLKVNGSLVLAPINRPADAVAGQLFYDKTTNQVNYFNGSSFIQILDSQAEVLKSVGGLTGAVGVGAGISTTNGLLTNNGVLSLQGQTGNVSFTAGSGILLNGTTLINNGITALGGQNGSISLGTGLILEGRTLRATGTQSVSGSGDIVVNTDENGNITISYTGTNGNVIPNLPVNSVVIGQGSGPLSSVSTNTAGMCLISTSGVPVFAACPGSTATGNVTTAGGTPGRIAKFSGTVELDDSLLSETGSTVNITGDINLSTGFGFYIDGQRLASGNLADSSNLCLVSTNNCGVTPGAFIQNGTVQQSSANFNIDGTGRAGTLNATAALQLGGININTAGTLSNVAYLNQNNAFTGNLTIGGNVRFSNLGAGLVFSDGSGVLSSNVVDRNNPVLLSGALDVANGGTGLNMITANGLVYGNGTATVGVTAAGTAGQIVVASSSRVPTFVTVSGDVAISSSGVTALGAGVVTNVKLANSSLTVSAGTNLTGGGVVALGNTITLNVASSPSFSGSVDSLGGYQLNGTVIISSTGVLQNVTANANIITSGTLPIARGGTGQSLAPNNGQLLIGNGSGYSLAGLTQGSGIAITNAAGSITVSVDSTVCTTAGNCSGGPSSGSGFYIQNGTTQQASANFNIDGTGTANTINAISALQLNGVSINTPGTLSNVAYLNQANAFSGNLSVTGSASLTIGSGAVTLGGLGAGLVQADASGVLSSSVLSRNSALLSGTLSIANGGTGLVTTPTNGQLLIGNGSGYTLANLTGINGVTITNAAGAITVGLNNTVCSASNPCESPPAGGSTNYIQNGTVQQAGANFNVSGGGTADTFNALTAIYINGNSLNTAGTLSNVAYLNQANNFSGNLSIAGTNNFSVGTGTITFAGLSTGIVQSSSTGVISSAVISRNDPTLLSGILSTANGGTGRSSFTANGLLYGNASDAINVTGSGTAGQLLIADASGVPTFVSASGDIAISAAGVATIQAGSVTNAKLANSSLTVSAGTNLTGGGVVALGGSVTLNVASAPTFSGNVDAASFSRSGTTVITSSSVLQNVTANANIITTGTLAVARGGTGVTALPANGQLLIGNGTGYTLAGLTAGDGVVITNAAGSITISVDNTVCTSANNCPNPAPGSNYYIQNSAAQQTGATFNIDGTGTANIYNAVTAYRLGGLDINSAGTLSNIAYLNQANTFSGNLTINGTNTLTVGSGAVTFGSLGAGLVQANASGVLSSSTVSRNSSALFSDTLSIVNGGTSVSTTPTNGQLLIGNGTGYTLATLVGAGGVTITNAAGAITVGLNNTVCTTDNTCTSPPEGGSNYYIQNGTVQQASANFNISGGGTANSLNAITALQLNGTDINTAGTLSNVAYLNQANTFSGSLTISGTNDLTVSGGAVRFGALGTGIVQSSSTGVISSGTIDRNSSTYLTGTLTTANGGTGRTSATANGLLYGAGTGALNVTAAGTSGQLLLANASGVPTFTTVSGDVAISASGATTIQNGVVTNTKLVNSSLTVSAGTNLTGGGVVALGGTVTLNVASAPTFTGNVDAASFSRGGTTIITSSSVLQNVTANANIITAGVLPIARGGTGLGTTPTNGQLLIGNGSGYTLAGLTAGTGVVITNAAGTITVSVDNSVCTTANNCPNPAPGSSYYIQNGTGQQTAANFNVDGTGTASIFNAVTAYRLNGLDINTAGTLSNVAYLNQANAFSGNLSVTGTNTLTVGTGAVTFGSLGAGLVQANASGVLSSGAVNRNSSALFSGTLSIANGGTGVTATPANGQLLIGNGSGYTVAALSAGDGISITNAAGAITVAVNSSVCSSTNPCTSPPAGGSTNYIQNGTVQQASADFNISGGGTANTFNAIAAIQLNGSNINTAGTLSNVAYLNQANTFSGNLTVATGNNLIVTNGSVTFGGLGAGIVQTSASGVLSSGNVDRNSATLFSNTLNVANGGTGRTSTTANGLLYGAGAGALGVTAAGTSGQLLIANASGVPTFVSVSGDVTISATGVTTIQDGTVTNTKLANSSVTINSSSNLVGGGSVALGGTLNLSVSSSPNFSGNINSVGGYQLNGTSVISSTGALANVTANASIITGGTFGIARGGTGLATTPTNGQLLIGNGTGYTLAGLTQGGGITITNAAGAITVAVDGTICTTANNCNYASGGGTSGSYIQNTTTQQASSNFNISGAGVIGTTLNVGGNTTLSGTLNVSGASTLASLGVTNNASVGGTLGVTGASTFTGLITANGGLAVTGAANSTIVYSSQVPGDTNPRFTIAADGRMGFGSGTAATDTNLYRVSTGVLRTDNALYVNGNNQVSGTLQVGIIGLTGAKMFIVPGNTTTINQVNRSVSSQTADFYQNQNSAGNALSGFNAAGNLYFQSSTFVSTLSTVALSANRSITLPDASGALCLDSNNCGYLTTTAASTSYIQNTTTQQAGSNFSISGTGTAAVLNATTGFRLNGTATAGQFLRGNGTNFVSSALQASDIPTGSNNYIQNGTTLQTGNFAIQSSGVNNVAAVIQRASGGQNVDLLQFKSSDGSTVLARFNQNGQLTVPSLTTTDFVEIGSTLNTHGNVNFGAFDFKLGTDDQVSRGNSGLSRALVKDGGNVLVINYDGDYNGGTKIASALRIEGDLSMNGTSIITSSRVLQNVTADANILSSGTVGAARLSGSYTGITGIGTLDSLTVTNNVNIGGGVNVSGAATVSSLIVNTAATVTTNLTVGGNFFVRGANQHYGFSTIDSSTAGWFKLGTLNIPQQGNNATVKLYGGSNYNANDYEEGHTEIFIRTSNGSVGGPSGFGATAKVLRYGSDLFASQVKLVSNAAGSSASSYDVYIYTGPFVGNGYYTVDTGPSGSWLHNVTSATDPGANSSTVLAATPYGGDSIGGTFQFSANTNAAANTTVPMNWNQEVSKKGVLHSNTTNPANITIVTPGYYAISGSVIGNCASSPCYRDYILQVNGTNVSSATSQPNPDTANPAFLRSSISSFYYYLNAGDVVRLVTYGNVSTNITGGLSSFMSIFYVGKDALIQSGPSGGSTGSFILNGTTQQASANFNIDGSGTIGASLNVGGAGTLGSLTVTNNASVGGNLNVNGAYQINGTSGATRTCTAGQILQGVTVSGGIVTGGTCVGGNNIGGTFALASNYTINTAADTPVNWTGENSVTGLTHSTSTNPQNITIQTAGYYLLAGAVEGYASVSNTYHDAMIKINGTAVARGNGTNDGANTAGFWKAVIAPVYRYLNVGDVLTLNVASGTGTTGLSGGDRTYFSVAFVSPSFAGSGSGGGSYINNGTAVQTANFNVQSASPSSITAVIRAATSQTADILQVQASDGTAYANIDAGGRLKVTPTSTTISNYASEITAAQGHALRLITNNATSGVRLTLQDNSISDSYSRWNLDNFQGYFRFFHENAAGDSGQTNLVINKSGNICIGTNMIRANSDFDCASNLGVAGSASVKVLSGQTADAFQVQNSSGTVLTDIASDGSLSVGLAANVSLSPAFTKLANPATLPAGNGNALAYSPDSQYMTVAHPTSPFITIYKRSGTTFTKLANPATLPTGQAYNVAWSPDGQYMSVFMNTSPFVAIYKRSGDTFTKISDPATLPTNAATSGNWSPDGQYLSLTTVVSPYVIIYKQSGDTFTKLANPATLPTSVAYMTNWSPDGKYMSVAHDASPFITIYKRSGDTFIKLTNPATLPASTAYSGVWSPDGQYMSVAHIGAPFLTVYKQSGDTFTKIANPATLPPGDAYSSNWSPDGNFLSVAHANSPYVSVYRRTGDILIKQANPGTLPPAVGNYVAWSPDSQIMSVAHVGSPYVTNYVANVISSVSNTPIMATLTVAGQTCIGSSTCNDMLGVNGSLGVQGFVTAANVNVMNYLQTGGVVRLDSLGNLKNIASINNTLRVYQSQTSSQFATEVSGQYGLRISGSSPRITLQDTTITSDVSRWNIDNLAGTFRLFRENQDSANGIVALTVAANNNVSLYTSGKSMDIVGGTANDIYQTWRSSSNGTTANNVSTIIGNLNNVGFVGTESNSTFMIRVNNTYQASFDSNGTFRARGSVAANTTPDIAEHIPAAPDVEAADVVMADPDNTERVVKASGLYNSSALGVISDGTSSFMINPYGNADGTVNRTDTKPLVLAGRVPVKVTNENGAIKPGDHLTTSSTTGHAMKATRAGATIGTALGFFDGTTGTVLVLVNPSYFDPYDGNNLQANTATISTLNATNATISNLTVGNLVVTGTVKAANVGARYFTADPAEIAHGTATTTLASLDIPDPGFAYVLQINSNLETTMPSGSRYDLTAMVNGQMVAYDRGDISPNWQRLNGTSPVMRGSSSVRLDMKRMYGDSFTTSATNRSFTVLLVPIKE